MCRPPSSREHTLSLGASYAITENITASFAWMHGFDNSIQGPILQVPGTSVKLTSQVDQILMGVNMTFGGRKKVAVPEPVPYPYPAVAEPAAYRRCRPCPPADSGAHECRDGGHRARSPRRASLSRLTDARACASSCSQGIGLNAFLAAAFKPSPLRSGGVGAYSSVLT